MAFRHKLRTRRHPRRNRRRRHRGSYGFAPSRWSPSVAVCPDKQWVKLRYAENITLQSATLVDGRVFRLNGPGDPNATAPLVGLQPTGYDQWTAMYTRYWVTSATMSLKIAPVDPSLPGAVFRNVNFVAFPSPYGVIPSDIETALTKARSKRRIINYNTGLTSLSLSATTKSITGNGWNSTQTAPIDSATNPWPIEQAYFIFLMQPFDKVTPSDVDVQVTIDYNIMFYNRRNIGDIPPSSSA